MKGGHYPPLLIVAGRARPTFGYASTPAAWFAVT